MTPERPSDARPQMLSTSLGEVRITDEARGAGAEGARVPLIAIHGLPGSIRDYRWLAPCVVPHTRMIRIDMPGFAGTKLSVMPDPSPSGRARLVLAVADALGIERFAVVGHSMGGPVAMALTAAAPTRIAGLVLLGSVGLRPHRFLRRGPDLRKLAWILRWVPGAKLALLPLVKRGFVKAGFSTQLTGQECHHSIRCVASTSFAAIGDWVDAIRAQETPSLVAWAEDDRLIEAAIFEALADALPEGPRLAFAEGGHNIQKTQAVELGETMGRWLPSL